MSERFTIRMTGDQIIAALLPELQRRLPASHQRRHWDIVTTNWDSQSLPPDPARPTPPGTLRMSMDVVFTLERRAERESS